MKRNFLLLLNYYNMTIKKDKIINNMFSDVDDILEKLEDKEMKIMIKHTCKLIEEERTFIDIAIKGLLVILHKRKLIKIK